MSTNKDIFNKFWPCGIKDNASLLEKIYIQNPNIHIAPKCIYL